jgi:hypothetical protein
VSSSPHHTWTPRHPAQHPARKLSWRLLHSWWLLLPLIGCSCLGGTGFLYVGLRASRRAWWLAGLGYITANTIATIFLLLSQDPEDPALPVGFALLYGAWAAGIIHSLLINSEWLRWRANRIPWHQTLPAGAPHPVQPWQQTPAPDGTLPAATTPPPHHHYGPGPSVVLAQHESLAAAASPTQPGVSHLPHTVPPQAPAGTVDVNVVTAQQLAAVRFFDPERAARVIAERDSRGRFNSIEEFAAAARLAPHEYTELLPLLACAPVPHR